MNTDSIVAELTAERDRLTAAITALGGIRTRHKTATVPAGGGNEESGFEETTRHRIQRTPAQKAATSRRMKLYWKKRRSEG